MLTAGLLVAGGSVARGWAAGGVQVSGPARPEPLARGEAVPDFVAPGLDGSRVAWTEVLGTPTLIVVWASWCPHCQRELPRLARIATEFPGVRLLTVTTSVGRFPGPTPREFVLEHRLAFPVAVDDERNTLAWALGVRRYPTMLWVGPDGRVRAVTEGERPEFSLRESFRNLVDPAR